MIPLREKCASGGLVEEKCLVGVRVEQADRLETIERQQGGGGGID